ncbi:MAG: hypothetical protein KDJ55_10850 [Rhodobiaceae bacterium]|nr:hypothetical protein [Rhodobiaceae bacterium]MCC0019406.1 hypothetical protein [Rhodobiaceae bacterium]MCC0050622.1 hypothetical protein [Rhodobiaceae bacterium]MCC0059825.1 hypothetical protein [Rhodobiaceae bacterium]
MSRYVCRMAAALMLLSVFLVASAHAQERNTIFFGPDLQVQTLQQPRWQNCQRRCDNNDRCVGWSYIEGVNQCRLKEAIWLKADNGCCISGYKQAAGGQPGGGGGAGGGGGGQQASPGIQNARVARLHYNAGAGNERGACIQTQPEIPNSFRNWACLWKDNPLYAEIDRMLSNAFTQNIACDIEWADRPRTRYAEIAVVSCRR